MPEEDMWMSRSKPSQGLTTIRLMTVGVLMMVALSVRADIAVPGADGSDEAFNPTSNVQIDLPQAATGQWDQPSPVAGKGVYDPNKWAVVFKYTSVNIPSGVTVTFKNHGSRAPVVWLVSGNVTIAGTLSLNGQNGHAYTVVRTASEPGPGGFRGGRGSDLASSPSGGFGPGGATPSTGGGSGSGGGYSVAGGQGRYNSAVSGTPGRPYGNASVLMLVGGSGACGTDRGNSAVGGGAGGGAILIASTAGITISGQIQANGGSGLAGPGDSLDSYRPLGAGGSGGSIRLIADSVTGGGRLYAIGGSGNGDYWGRSSSGSGANGRIRIEANSVTLADQGNPISSMATPGSSAVLWPAENSPTIKATLLDGQDVPGDSLASLEFPYADVSMSNPNMTTVRLECTNVPLNWNVKVRVVPKTGQDFTVDATFVSGDASASVWQAPLTLPNGFCAIQARATKP